MKDRIAHGTSRGAYQQCLKRPEGSCRLCKDYVAEYQRNKTKKTTETREMAIVRIVKYVIRCDACGKEVETNKEAPTAGTVGQIEFPNSAHGQRRTYTFYSCKEDAAHISRAIRAMAEKRKDDVDGRKARGEKYESEQA